MMSSFWLWTGTASWQISTAPSSLPRHGGATKWSQAETDFESKLSRNHAVRGWVHALRARSSHWPSQSRLSYVETCLEPYIHIKTQTGGDIHQPGRVQVAVQPHLPMPDGGTEATFGRLPSEVHTTIAWHPASVLLQSFQR